MQEGRGGCLGTLFGLFTSAETKPGPLPSKLPYARKYDFLSPAEAAFFVALRSAIGETYLIFSKVRLADVCYIPRGPGSTAALNRVSSKHLDFLLCDMSTLRPVLAVELDDSSHQRADRAQRDVFVDEVLNAVELPFVRFKARAGYGTDEVRSTIQAAIATRGGQRPT